MTIPKDYSSFQKFHVAVDCVIFGYEENSLRLLLYPRKIKPHEGEWSLLGGFLNSNESLEAAAQRVVSQIVGIEDIFMEQVCGFSEPNRDPAGRVVSIAFYALIPVHKYDKEMVSRHGGIWWDINKLPKLVFDHGKMVEKSLEKLRVKASHEVIGKELLPPMFTLNQLNNLYNAIFNKVFDSPNFRKKISSLDVLERLPIKNTQTSKKGSHYYRFKSVTDTIDFERIIKI
jgi:ADP-ribose pyrophosphatase YjhB (NUDIX family)